MRYRAGNRLLRQQVKWLALIAAMFVVAQLIAILVLLLGKPWLSGIADTLVAIMALFGIPAAMATAILRGRLYDIDRIISRTLAYAIVTGLLVGVYAGLVLLATQVLPFSTPVAVAASTLAAAALFNPLRRQVQQMVDRRFHRARYDADRTIAAFAIRLKDAVDLDSVRDDLTAVVHQVLEPAHISVSMTNAGSAAPEDPVPLAQLPASRITDASDTHVQAERTSEDGDGPTGPFVPGRLMAACCPRTRG